VATAGPALRPARGRPSLHGLDATTTALIAVGASLLAVALCLNALAIVASRPAVLPILAVGAIGIAAMLVQPAWIFPALVGLTWSSLGTAVLGGLPSPIEVGALAFLVVALIRAAKRPALSREALLVCALFGLPVVIAAFTARSDAALAVVPDLGKDLVFLFLVALCVVSLRDVQRVAMALTVTGFILGAGAIYSVLVGPTPLFPLQNVNDAVEAPRAVGPFGEANFFALSLAVLVPFALFQVARGGRVAVFGGSRPSCSRAACWPRARAAACSRCSWCSSASRGGRATAACAGRRSAWSAWWPCSCRSSPARPPALAGARSRAVPRRTSSPRRCGPTSPSPASVPRSIPCCTATTRAGWATTRASCATRTT
jgi:hypothetical protein